MTLPPTRVAKLVTEKEGVKNVRLGELRERIQKLRKVVDGAADKGMSAFPRHTGKRGRGSDSKLEMVEGFVTQKLVTIGDEAETNALIQRIAAAAAKK